MNYFNLFYLLGDSEIFIIYLIQWQNNSQNNFQKKISKYIQYIWCLITFRRRISYIWFWKKRKYTFDDWQTPRRILIQLLVIPFALTHYFEIRGNFLKLCRRINCHFFLQTSYSKEWSVIRKSNPGMFLKMNTYNLD